MAHARVKFLNLTLISITKFQDFSKLAQHQLPKAPDAQVLGLAGKANWCCGRLNPN